MDKASDKPEQKNAGIFQPLVNRAAFLDTVWVRVFGTQRMRQRRTLALSRTRAIGGPGPGRFYARALPGTHVLSANPFQLRYGRLHSYKNLAPFSLTIWSDGSPVTCAQTLLTLDGLMRLGYQAAVSAVELTFDVQGIPMCRLARELVTRATVREVHDRWGLATLYIGAPRSPCRATIYRKSVAISRVEFKFGSAFLRGMKIRRLQELYVLRKANLWSLVSFRTVNQAHGGKLPPRVRGPWESRGIGLPPRMAASIVTRELRGAAIDPSAWVVRSPTENLLREMQQRLIW